MRVSLLLLFAFFCSAIARSEAGTRQLPIPVVEKVCEKYNGASAFVKDGKVTKISCTYVDKLARIDGPTMVEKYRDILTAAATLDGLRQSRELPADLSCGSFQERRQGAARLIECSSILAGQSVPFTFVADERGQLSRLETSMDFAKIYRSSMESAVKRGTVSEFYDSYISLQTDLLVEKLRFTAHKDDVVLADGGKVTVVVRVEP